MRNILIVIAVLCGVLAAQSTDSAKSDKTPRTETDPITDKVRLDIARTQRDLLLADARMKDAIERYNAARSETEGLQRALAEKIAEAGKACGDRQAFDAEKLTCVPRPSPAKEK
jgi:hypothetical protein